MYHPYLRVPKKMNAITIDAIDIIMYSYPLYACMVPITNIRIEKIAIITFPPY